MTYPSWTSLPYKLLASVRTAVGCDDWNVFLPRCPSPTSDQRPSTFCNRAVFHWMSLYLVFVLLGQSTMSVTPV